MLKYSIACLLYFEYVKCIYSELFLDHLSTIFNIHTHIYINSVSVLIGFSLYTGCFPLFCMPAGFFFLFYVRHCEMCLGHC